MPTKNHAELTPKQELFCHEYVVDLNATQAAIRAGYSEKTARSQGQRLLTNVAIQDQLKTLQAERFKATDLSAEWVLEKIKLLSETCLQMVPAKENDGGELVEIKNDAGEPVYRALDQAGANSALEKLSKHFKLFADRIDHNHSGSVQFNMVYHPGEGGDDE